MMILLIKKVDMTKLYPLMENAFCSQTKCVANTCISPDLTSAKDILLRVDTASFLPFLLIVFEAPHPVWPIRWSTTSR